MNKVLILSVAIIFINIDLFAQLDSNDVYIINNEDSINNDTTIKGVAVNTALKIDLVRTYTADPCISLEQLSAKNNRRSNEYEISFDLMDFYWFWHDFYTDKNYEEDILNYTDSSFSYSTDFSEPIGFTGLAYTRKIYLSKLKSGMYGWYLGGKIKDRFGFVTSGKDWNPFKSNNDKKLSRLGIVNYVELYMPFGYMTWWKEIMCFDFFLGPGVLFSNYPVYSIHKNETGFYLDKERKNNLFPVIQFGFRIGFSGTLASTLTDSNW